MTPPVDAEPASTPSIHPISDVPGAACKCTSSVSIFLLMSLAGLNFFRIGCQLVMTAWSAVQATGRTESVGHILLVSSVANLALAPLLGVAIDRYASKKPLAVGGHVGIALSGAMPCAIQFLLPDVTPFAGLACVVLLSCISGIVIGGAMDYYTKLSILPGDRIKKLAMINSICQLTLIAGTAVGGYLVSCTSWRNAFLAISSCGLLLAFLSGTFLPALTAVSAERINWRRGMLDIGPALYLRHHQLFCIACCSALAFAIGQITNTLLPALMSLQLGLTSKSYALAEAAWSIGAFFASVGLANMAKAKIGGLSRDVAVVFVVASILFIVPRLSWFPALLAAHVILGVGFSFVRVRSEARFIAECPTHLLGRFRANSLFLTSLVGVVVFATPTVFEHSSISALYQLLSVVVAMSAVALLQFTLFTRPR